MSGTNIFQPPPATKFNFLSLGAGVQSSVLALQAAAGEIDGPQLDACLFADTQAEPPSVYKWLDYLETQLPFPVYRLTTGSLSDESLKIRTSGRTGQTYLSHNVPAYTINSNGSLGNYRRQCTDKHKLSPLLKACDELRGKDSATVWIGISWDELQRVRESKRKGVFHRWPLLEKEMRRHHCLEWMAAKGFPTPPRSACSYCPYHSNKEWRRLRDQEPAAWKDALEYEKKLQEKAEAVPRLDGVPFLHPSRVPLAEVNLHDEPKGQGMLWQDMNNECSGLCGN